MLKPQTVDTNGRVQRVASRKPGDDGLACVAVMLAYYDIKGSLKSLVKRYPRYAMGMNLRGVMEILQIHGLRTRALECPVESVGELALPCILHWNMQQFVVLAEIENDTLYISDPVSCRTEYTWEEFEAHYSEVALEVYNN